MVDFFSDFYKNTRMHSGKMKIELDGPASNDGGGVTFFVPIDRLILIMVSIRKHLES